MKRSLYLLSLILAVSFTVLSTANEYAAAMDTRVESAANESYVFKTYLKDDSIKVNSNDDIVTLTGTVGEQSHLSLANDTVAVLPGVKSVKNKLTMNDKTPAPGTDAWLITEVAVLGDPLAHGAPDETIKSPSSVHATEVGKDEKPSHPPKRLYGTWTAKDVDAKMGEVKIRLTFRREKDATFLAWSDIPFVGQVRDLKAAFSVHGDTISSEAIRDGKKAKFSFENDQLVLCFKSGKVVRFNRE